MNTGTDHGFTDIHTHLFPSVDDGAGDMETALDLARLAWENGTDKLFLTPHFRRDVKTGPAEWYRDSFRSVRDTIRARFPGMRVYLGSEITYEMDVPELLSAGKLLTMNGSEYVLLELRGDMGERSIISAVYETVRNGFVPILAHVDRFAIFRRQADLADQVLANGALIQLNAESVMGKNGFGVKRFCHQLLKDDKVHFIASDAHDAVRRPPILKPCYQRVAKKYGPETANRLFSQNAQMLFAKEREAEKHEQR